MKKFENLGRKLSKEEQKNIGGGVQPGCSTGTCSVYNSTDGKTYDGNCGWQDLGGGAFVCECVTKLGIYFPQGGTSHCYRGTN